MKIARVLGVLVWVLGVCFGDTGDVASEEKLSAEEVLRRFAEGRKNMKSFHITGEMAERSEYRGKLNKKGERFEKFDNRYDGNRWSSRRYVWGDINRTYVEEEDADYYSVLWDGQDYYNYTGGSVTIYRQGDVGGVPEVHRTSLLKGSWEAEVVGCHLGDDACITELFKRDAKSLRLREKVEKVGGSDCYVIEAGVQGKGQYTVWIDPGHDWHVARIKVNRRVGDKFWANTLKEGEYSRTSCEVAEWNKVGEVWFPREYIFKWNKFNHGNHLACERQARFNTVVFEPDHEALKSFVANDIRNGTTVRLPAYEPDGELVWRDGKIIDGEGREVDIKAKVERQK